MATQSDHFAKIEAQLASLLSAQKATSAKLDAAVSDVAAMRDDVNKTKDIVEAWNAMKTGGRFLKWLGGVVAALTAIVAAAKLGAAQFMGR